MHFNKKYNRIHLLKILSINCGSSSIKYSLFEMPEERVLARGLIEKIGEKGGIPSHRHAMEKILERLTGKKDGVIRNKKEIEAVGHRVVHGGEYVRRATIIDENLLKMIARCIPLAPLHNPHNITGIRISKHLLPATRQVAIFDTAFHQTLAPEAFLYALPYELYEKYKIRRYGFHGTSHYYLLRRLEDILNKKRNKISAITCHLGNGCSLAAIKHGRCIDTSMGFTPLEGLVMGTRSGDIDPAIIFYLVEEGRMNIKEIKDLLNKKSGLSGISGVSNDVRDIEREARAGNKRAKLALDIFSYRVKKYIGAYMAILGEVDAIVFTGGIGENAWYIRERICQDLTRMGIRIDKDRNRMVTGKEGMISGDVTKVKVFVVPTDEEVSIVYETYEVFKKTKGERYAGHN